MIGLVIFDCDGVLIDSELLSARVWTEELAGFGVTFDLDTFERHFLGRSFPKVVAALREHLGVDLPPDFEARFRARLIDLFAAELAPTPGVREMLDAIQVPYCVATSSTPSRADRSLRIAGLRERVGSRLFTASEVARGKPAPDLFLHAARGCGVDPAACLVIEDSAPGLAAGAAAGMRTLHFTGGSHMRGRASPEQGTLGSIGDWGALRDLLPQLFAVEGAA